MKKTEFSVKEVQFEGDYGVIATRTRNTTGRSVIIITAGSQKMTFDTLVHGDNYEMIAREVAEALDGICNDMCTLPRVGK